jgi:hypothetical protein
MDEDMHDLSDTADTADRRLRALRGLGLPAPSPLDVLAGRVVARQRRQRRTAVAGALTLALVVSTSVVAAAQRQGGTKHVRAADMPNATTSSTDDPTTESTNTTSTSVPVTTSTMAGATAPPRSGTTTTTKPCRNSYDPDCGAFYWLTSPGANAPMTFSVTYTPEHPKAGEEVTFHIVADDPDAPQDNWLSYRLGRTLRIGDYASCPRWRLKYGGWSPPARIHGHYEWDLTLTVPEHDWEWDWEFSTNSAFCDVGSLDDGSAGARDGKNPYASPGRASGRLDAVAAQPTTESSG